MKNNKKIEFFKIILFFGSSHNEIFFFIFNDYVNQLKFWNLRNNSSGEVNNLCCDDNKSTYYQVDIPRVIDESIVDYFDEAPTEIYKNCEEDKRREKERGNSRVPGRKENRLFPLR